MTTPQTHCSPSTIRALVADDSRLWLEQVCKLLISRPNISLIATACNGAEAVQRVQELKPDLVLLDVQMPRMNGFEAVAGIRIHHPAARVVMMSADEEAWVRRGCFAHGADAFVGKSQGPAVLLNTISDLFAAEASETACVAAH